MTTIDRKHCLDARKALQESNDCTVRACAVATNIPYPDMHQYLEDECGRKHRDGLYSHQYHDALRALGYKLTKLEGPDYEYASCYVEGHWRYCRRSNDHTWVDGTYRNTRRKVGPGLDYNAATVTKIAKELPTGTYLIGMSGHVACLREGEVHDFTANRRHRITSVYRVEEEGCNLVSDA